jgi:beta-glucosidase
MDESDRDGQRGREKLLAKLGLEDKISLLTGADYWLLHGHPGIGYRHFDRAGREPRYSFGHGLGFTPWEYLAAEVMTPPPAGGAGAEAVIRVQLRNAGTRHGCETVQVYASRPDSAVERPVRWLAGFAKAEAPPGTEVIADIVVSHRRLAHWDIAVGMWAIEPGDFHLHIGRSSRDVPLSVTVRC